MSSASAEWAPQLVVSVAVSVAENEASLIKYFSVSALVIVLWDYFLLLDEEITFIWRRPGSSLASWVFRINRYWTLLGIIHINTILIFLPRHFMGAEVCKSLTSLVVLYTIVETFGTNAYLTLRHVQAWDGRRVILYMIIAALVLTHIPAIILGALSMKEMFENTTYVPLLRTCGILTKTEKLAAAWACVVTYDTLAIVLSIINALDRPRRRDADVISYLQGDGAPFFMVVFVLRYSVLGLILKLPAPELFIPALVVWPVTSATLSRFILESEKLRIRRRIQRMAGYAGNFEMDVRR